MSDYIAQAIEARLQVAEAARLAERERLLDAAKRAYYGGVWDEVSHFAGQLDRPYGSEAFHAWRREQLWGRA